MNELPSGQSPAAVLLLLIALLGLSVSAFGRKGFEVLFDPLFLCVFIALLAIAADYIFFGYLPSWGD